MLANACRKQMRRVEPLSSEDDYALAYTHAKEVAEERNHLLIMKRRCQRLLENEVLSADQLKLAHMYEEGSMDGNHQRRVE